MYHFLLSVVAITSLNKYWEKPDTSTFLCEDLKFHCFSSELINNSQSVKKNNSFMWPWSKSFWRSVFQSLMRYFHCSWALLILRLRAQKISFTTWQMVVAEPRCPLRRVPWLWEVCGAGQHSWWGQCWSGSSEPRNWLLSGVLCIYHLYLVCPAELGCPSSSCKYPSKEWMNEWWCKHLAFLGRAVKWMESHGLYMLALKRKMISWDLKESVFPGGVLTHKLLDLYCLLMLPEISVRQEWHQELE